MDRRIFIRQLEVLAGGVLCRGLPVLLSACSGVGYVNAAVVGSRLVVRKEDFGAGRFVLVEDAQLPLPIYLYRRGDDDYSAVLTRCTHRGCQVEPAAGHLVCPCHGSEYTNAGEVIHGPAERNLDRFVVTTDLEHVYIELPAGGAS